MKKYEYKTNTIDAKGFNGGKVDVAEFDNMLNHMGRNGWELVETTASNQGFGDTRYILCTFKRELTG